MKALLLALAVLFSGSLMGCLGSDGGMTVIDPTPAPPVTHLTLNSDNQAPGQSYSVVIDSSFPEGVRNEIKASVDAWETALDGYLQVPSVSVGTCTNDQENVVCFHSAAPKDIEYMGQELGVGGYANWNNQVSRGDVWLPTNITESTTLSMSTVEAIMTHEIGHAFGLEHTQAGTVMFWEVSSDLAPAPTCSDVAQWFAVRNMGNPATTNCPNGGSFTLSGKP